MPFSPLHNLCNSVGIVASVEPFVKNLVDLFSQRNVINYCLFHVNLLSLIAGKECILDPLEFARNFIDKIRGNSLANLSWKFKFLCERKMQIVPKYPKLLPCDVMDLGEGYCTHFLHYCFNDSVLSLKLFISFQLGAQQFSSYRMLKQSAPKLFKHDEVLLQLQDSVYRYHLLRTHVSMCFAAWTEALLKIDQHDLFVPTDITCQTYYAIAATIQDRPGTTPPHPKLMNQPEPHPTPNANSWGSPQPNSTPTLPQLE
ncbi:hypothetical protein RCL1_007892 [Eukaryota sp. TZLM3-RCL]